MKISYDQNEVKRIIQDVMLSNLKAVFLECPELVFRVSDINRNITIDILNKLQIPNNEDIDYFKSLMNVEES